MRPLLAVLSLVLSTAALAATPDLIVTSYAEFRVDPGLPFPFTVDYWNQRGTEATGVVITIDLPPNVGVASPPAPCTANGGRIECAIGTLAPVADPRSPAASELRFQLIAPPTPQTTFAIDTEIHGNEGDAAPVSNQSTSTVTTTRTIAVTTTADGGDGSLRDAIVSANALCSVDAPCRVSFQIAGGGAAWQTIRPRSPLPAVTAGGVTIDGRTQTTLGGDTNPNGPEIEINGAEAGEANGLEIDTGCAASILGLAINGFAGAGLYLHGPDCQTEGPARVVGGNYVGTDPTGTIAVPNGRGIIVDTQPRWPFWISENVISGNRRTGIFVVNGATMINRCSIGLGADRRPLGNGASGVYVSPGGRGTDLRENFIGFNHDSGLSVARGAEWVSAGPNSFQGNWQLAIDYGLDGVSTAIPLSGNSPLGMMHAPEITLARYDAVANRTLIEGTVAFETQSFFGGFSVELYANDAPDENGYGEGQYVLGSALAPNGRFSFSYPGRLPGPWVTATAENYTVWGLAKSPSVNAGGGGYATTTSEFGRAVKVTE